MTKAHGKYVLCRNFAVKFGCRWFSEPNSATFVTFKVMKFSAF
jgi:hypothetical protein